MLENMLHYFMVTLDLAVAGMNEHEWAIFEANASCGAAEEFFACKNPQKSKGALLSGTKKYYNAIKVFAANKKIVDLPAAEQSWIDFSAVAGVVRRRRRQLSLRDCSRS